MLLLGTVWRRFIRAQEAFYRKFQIKHRLLSSFLLLSVVPLVIVALFSFWYSYADAREKIGYYSLQLTNQMQMNADQVLADYDQIANTIMKSDLIQNEFKTLVTKSELERYAVDEKLDKLLSSHMVNKYDIDGITVMHVDGRYRMFVGNRMVPREYKNTQLFTQSLTNTGRALWLPPHYNEVAEVFRTSEKVITYSSPLKDRWSGHDIGVIAIAIKPQSLAKLFKGQDFLQNGEAFILDENGTYIYNRNERLWGVSVEDLKLSQSIFKPSGSTATSRSYFDYEANGNKFLVSYTLLNSNHWAIVSMVPYAELMKKTNLILQFTVMIIVLFLLFAVYISLTVSSSISNAIQGLMSSFRQVEKGDFHIEVDRSGKDEVMKLNIMYKRMVERLNQLINELYRTKLMNKEVQIQALKAQINPHFLYNTLETISSIARMRQVREISDMTRALSAMFRYSIKGEHDFVTLRAEIDNIENYMSILKIRFGSKISLELDIPEFLYDAKMLKFMLQPIVENAVRHGIEMKKGSGIVKITALQEDDLLYIRIRDNGLGIAEEKLRELRGKLEQDLEIYDFGMKGIGLLNVKDRLRLYYREHQRFAIDSIQGEGTVITIGIPMNSEPQVLFVNKVL
jgi:two-component system sensor histidine kinase YesM